MYMTRIFKKKIGPSLPFLAAGTTDTKFLGSTGVATANSTNKDQKYKSVELGDQLGNPEHNGGEEERLGWGNSRCWMDVNFKQIRSGSSLCVVLAHSVYDDNTQCL